MQKLTRWMLALGLCLALTICGALAAEGDITVQLDGAPLAFTDAVPQVRDQRTYLPFRAVFEAMGAEVDYEGEVITAKRGDKTLTMTLNSTEATVVENGVTLPVHMDVAPYVDTATWRTYVPVRFAAQAFDCVVGWDQARSTAIIIDAEKLINAAKDGKSFTYLEKLAAMNEKYNTGLWDMTATFDADTSMFNASVLTMDGTVKGVTADSANMDMTMDMKLDMDGLMSMVSAMGGQKLTDEDKAMLDALKTDGINLTMRGNITTGKIYMNMDMGALGAKAGVEADAWYELDMASLMKQNGLEWNALMTMSENSDMLDTLIAVLNTTEPTDSATAFANFKSDVDALLAAFSDQGFESKDGGYMAEYTAQEDGINVVLTLTMEVDQVAAYAMDITANSAMLDTPVSMTMNVNMTADGNMNAGVDMNVGGMFTLTMVMDGSYVPGTTAPVVTPPAGAKILPFDDLMKQGSGLGVIGGGDGPTSILVSTPA